MAKNLIRLDIVEGNPRSIVCEVALEQGLFVEIEGKADAMLEDGVDREAYKVKLATAECDRGDLLIHASVPNMYDERLLECDFELEAGRVGRGYQPILGDIITVPQAIVEGAAVVVGDLVKLAGDGKIEKADSADDGVVVGKVEALEDIEIPMYTPQFGQVVEDAVQHSVVIRFR